jgi:TetR/AcrR family transcriptional repressor of nem operon
MMIDIIGLSEGRFGSGLMAKDVPSRARPIGRPAGRDGLESARVLLDAAEKRMRYGGFNAVSFRDIGEDVGVPSSSVHFHFPTKENLAAAVVCRYTDDTTGVSNAGWRSTRIRSKHGCARFRSPHIRGIACPCTLLATTAQELPREVASEVKHFYKMCLYRMTAAGLTTTEASELVATITGALVLANALGDHNEYDRATNELVREH